MSNKKIFLSFLLLAVMSTESCSPSANADGGSSTITNNAGYPTLAECVTQIETIRAAKQTDIPLSDVYADLVVIDMHNHDAANDTQTNFDRYTKYHLDRVVYFGDGSNFRATGDDQTAFARYRRNPDQVYPNFAGVPIYDDDMKIYYPKGTTPLDVVRVNLEQGFFGIGEIVGNSEYSPSQKNKEWKAFHPNDGYLPEIYALAAEYKVPVLLHIDPPVGIPITHLQEALTENPETVIIFGHFNAYSSPDNVHTLLAYDNLYLDFFAGFTRYNSGSEYSLESFAQLMEMYPDKFFISTDSGAEITYKQAVDAIYETIDLLTPETACKVAYLNYLNIIEAQQPTATMLQQVADLSSQLNEKHDTAGMNKRLVHELIFDLETRLEGDD